MSKVKDESYFQVSGWMINRLNLKGTTLNVYAIIYGFTQDGESEFKGSRQYLCDFTGATKPTIDKSLDDLIRQDLIFKKTETINGLIFNKYKANLEALKNFTGSKETLPPDKETLQGGSKETLPNNYNLDNNNYNINIIAEQIITYLNEKAGTHFKPVDSNIKFIKSRLKDYTQEDLKAVIDKKVKEWKGTEMQPYLRPETLFNATKFESYINGLESKRKNDTNFNQREYAYEDFKNLITDIDSIEL